MIRLILATLLILGAGAVPASAAALSGTTRSVQTNPVVAFRDDADSGAGSSWPPVVPLSAGLVPPLVALRGVATWFPSCHRCAAASGELQAALGPRWQGMTVRVVHGGRHVDVRLVTGCGCGPRPKGPTVIDLSPDAFQALVPGQSIASIGVLRVVVEAGDVPALPPTDAAEPPAKPVDWFSALAYLFVLIVFLIVMALPTGGVRILPPPDGPPPPPPPPPPARNQP